MQIPLYFASRVNASFPTIFSFFILYLQNFPPLSSLSFYSSALSHSEFRAAKQHKIFTHFILICNVVPPNFQFIQYLVLATRVKYKCTIST